ncbi:fluoride efflux transporter CrcB [Hamadaea tsunoensis]|uniref:fluoride efflux transporter CrcB n=1 Tax=Hamadaea tsunoensis TaxID=53368 RepID=UPI00041EB963|nr:fluoride efflux transporter CrcB [Hamadaea tsunoensis]
MTVLLVALGAAFGAPARYLVDRAVGPRRFPYGTMIVNVAGSFVLGWAATALDTKSGAYALVGTGFCGALTTYSTFGYETVRLAESGEHGKALLNVIVSIALGSAGAYLGFLAA